MTAYYNEFDPFAAQWLRNLIDAKLIAPGIVDDRSITDVTASDLRGFTQCHFFAGIGGWSLALRLAGVPDNFRCWTGSPPCQPFSTAGKQLGQLDERHLAPTFMRLISQCKPSVIFGEQVAAAIAKHWLDDLFIELENENYACGAAVLPACSVGAPHKRDRLFFGAQLAQPVRSEWDGERLYGLGEGDQTKGGWSSAEFTGRGDTCGVAYPNSKQQRQKGKSRECDEHFQGGREQSSTAVAGFSSDSGMDHTKPFGWNQRWNRNNPQHDGEQPCSTGSNVCSSENKINWSDADWLGCRDGKFRAVEPGTFPLANGIPTRVGRLRGYGNAIVPQVAAEFVSAFLASFDGAVE